MTAPTMLLFDVDGTLVCASTPREERLENAFAAVGIEPFCTVEELLTVLPQVEGTTHDELTAACFRRLAKEKERPMAAAEQVAATVELAPPVSTVTPVEWAQETLTILQNRGYTLGVVTNGPKSLQRAKLQCLDLDDQFETMVFGDPERGLKPAVAPFEIAIEDLGVTPAETVVIGDAYQTDIGPAHDLDMMTMWIPRKRTVDQPAPKADHIIHSLSQLLTEFCHY